MVTFVSGSELSVLSILWTQLMAWTQLFIQLLLGLLGLSLIRSLLLPRFPKLREKHLDTILILFLLVSEVIYLVDDQLKEEKGKELKKLVKAAESKTQVIDARTKETQNRANQLLDHLSDTAERTPKKRDVNVGGP
jgi:hypothetical protein